MTAGRLRAAFVAAASAWALLLLAAPFAASRPHASAWASLLIVGVYSIGSLVCHQLPARSFHLWTAQMPVCARCAGIYFGAAVSAIVLAVFRTAEAMRHSRAIVTACEEIDFFTGSLSPARVALALAVVPSLLTLIYEWTAGHMPSHAIRAAAGVPIGVAVAWLVVAATDNRVD
jgi:hypothetical protein